MKYVFLVVFLTGIAVNATTAQVQKKADTAKRAITSPKKSIKKLPKLEPFSSADSALVRDLFGKNARDANSGLVKLGGKQTGNRIKIELEDTSGTKKLYQIDTFCAFTVIKLWQFEGEKDFSVKTQIQKVYLYKIPVFAGVAKRYSINLRL